MHLAAATLKKWLDSEKDKLEKKRRYLHFDKKISFRYLKDDLLAQVTNPDWVASRSFLPLLQFKKIENKYSAKEKKNKKKERLLSYASHLDACILSYYAEVLKEPYENLLRAKGLSEVPTAYRSMDGRCNIHFAAETFEWIKAQGECTVIALDIENFFDSLNHSHLKETLKKVLTVESLAEDFFRIYKNMTLFSSCDKNTVFKRMSIKENDKIYRERICTPKEFREIIRGEGLISHDEKTTKGIPQGTPISGLLANLYMLDFDEKLNELAGGMKGLYRRYSDDIFIAIPGKNIADETLEKVCALLAQSHLKSNKRKEQISIFKWNSEKTLRAYDNSETTYEDINYLGFGFNGTDAYIASKTLSRYYGRMARQIHVFQKWTDSESIKRIARRKYIHTKTQNFPSYAKRASGVLGETKIPRQIHRTIEKLSTKI